nr:MAG: hypothetical protein DIU57_16550 [Pseudomonadota bacterium]
MEDFLVHLKGNILLSVLASLAALMFAHFLFQYVVRGINVRQGLRRQASAVRSLLKVPAHSIKDELKRLFTGTRTEFAWNEFEETLHEQYLWDLGEKRIVAIRATVPAEAFFNAETAVDPWLGTEYFKHLPVILTSLGIVGTFSGLIMGLMDFNPSATDPEGLRNSLGGLFAEVRYAFTFSAIAIGLAIVVTAAEKWLYSSCVKWVGELAQGLDGLFRAGIGEEYLSSLVQASHENATQVRQLKESLVEDLKALLTNLTERQIQATQQLSVELGQQIERSLQSPLERIAETVRIASGKQSEVAGAVLENLMTSFLAQMRETLGGQLSDLSGLMQATATAMSQVELAMRSLVSDMRAAAEQSSTSVHGAIRDLMEKLAEHHQQQTRTVSSSTQVVMDKLQVAVQRIAEAQEEASRRTRDSATAVAAVMEERISALASANAETVRSMKEGVERMGEVSTEAIEKMSSGAAAVVAAVQGLQQAADRMTSLSDHLASLEERTIGAAQKLDQSSAELGAAAQYLSRAMEQLAGTSGRLESVSRSITSEYEARQQLLHDLRDVISRAQVAANEFSKLREEVNSALTTTIEQFGKGVGDVLRKHLTDYQKQLGDAVSMLQGALEELAEYASSARE